MSFNSFVLAALVSIFMFGCTDTSSTDTANNNPPANSLMILASEQTPHNIGKFNAATNSLVAAKGETGALMFGPYIKLAPGHYEATFLISAESAAENDEIGTVDINAISGDPKTQPIATTLKAIKGQQSIKLSFDAISPDTVYEFRVFVNGKADKVGIKSVKVEK